MGRGRAGRTRRNSVTDGSQECTQAYIHYCTCGKPGKRVSALPPTSRCSIVVIILCFFRVLCFYNRVVMTIALRRPRFDRHGFHTTLGGEGRKRWFVHYVYVTLFLQYGRREAPQGVWCHRVDMCVVKRATRKRWERTETVKISRDVRWHEKRTNKEKTSPIVFV